MNTSLGKKIKALRKELKLTQTALAGTEMTKSMLSQIENNLAMPSMKNLQYLAASLGKPVAYFLEEEPVHSALPSDKIHEELKGIAELIRLRKQADALSKLKIMETDYHFDRSSKLYADYLSKYGECLIDLDQLSAGKEKIHEAVRIYKAKYLFVEAAKVHLNLIGVPWNEFDYPKCMDIVEEASTIYHHSINRDYAFEIEALYIKSVLLAGMDQLEASIAAIEEALNISKQTHIYYKSDELYKNLAGMNGFLGRLEHFEEDIEKGRQFAIFADNRIILASIEGVCGLYSNELGRPEKALEYLDKALQISEEVASFANAEKARAFYLLHAYSEALEVLERIEYPKHTLFKYDYLQLWSSKIYKGLVLHQLGSSQTALTEIRLGIEKIKVVGESKALVFAYKSLSEIYSALGEYENAFTTLKAANEMDEIVKQKKLYY